MRSRNWLFMEAAAFASSLLRSLLSFTTIQNTIPSTSSPFYTICVLEVAWHSLLASFWHIVLYYQLPILYEEQLQLHISMAQSGLLLPLSSVIEGRQTRRLSHEVSSFSLSMSPCHLDHPLQRGVHHQDWSEDDTTPSWDTSVSLRSVMWLYSPGQANLQFSFCDTQILCEIKFGNLRRYENAICVDLEVRNFDFWC